MSNEYLCPVQSNFGLKSMHSCIRLATCVHNVSCHAALHCGSCWYGTACNWANWLRTMMPTQGHESCWVTADRSASRLRLVTHHGHTPLLAGPCLILECQGLLPSCTSLCAGLACSGSLLVHLLVHPAPEVLNVRESDELADQLEQTTWRSFFANKAMFWAVL